jgi:hypothetical protein
MNIIQTSDNTYEMTIRGAHMTLVRRQSVCGNWEMTTVNAAAQAWNRIIMPKHFNTLEEIEAKYKSWRGVSKLIGVAN